MQVDDASALEDTLARLRQRYALYFYLPEGSTSADQRNVQVDLSNDARRRFQEAEIHYRRVYLSASASQEHSGPVIKRAQQPADLGAEVTPTQDDSMPKGRRVAVNEDSAPRVNTIDPDAADSSQQATPPAQAPQATQPPQPSQNPSSGTQPPPSSGWPRANPQKPPP
jgi:hypothetical protein